MGKSSNNTFLGWVFIGGMVVVLLAMGLMMSMGLEAWVIAWLTIVTGSVVGMFAGMVLLIRSFRVEEPNGSSS